MVREERGRGRGDVLHVTHQHNCVSWHYVIVKVKWQLATATHVTIASPPSFHQLNSTQPQPHALSSLGLDVRPLNSTQLHPISFKSPPYSSPPSLSSRPGLRLLAPKHHTHLWWRLSCNMTGRAGTEPSPMGGLCWKLWVEHTRSVWLLAPTATYGSVG